MSGSTTNFNWILPIVGGDADIWGGDVTGLNFNLITQDSLIRRLINTFINATEPAEKQSGTMWIDNTVNPWIWKVYNAGTTTWIEVGEIDPINNTFTPSSGNSNANSVGDLKLSTQASSHGQWLLCNGAAVSRATYSALAANFAAQTPQYPFGDGDGVTTFNLPDIRGRVAGMIGAGTGLTTRTIGENVGEETHTLISAELPDPVTSATAIASFAITGGASGIQSTAGTGLGGNAGIIRNVGGNAGHNNIQPTVFAGNYFIFAGV